MAADAADKASVHTPSPSWRRHLSQMAIGLLAAVAVVGCSMQFDPRATAYVTIDPARTEEFLGDLSAIARKHGLTSWPSSLKQDDRWPFHILEGEGRALRIWAQNMLLSGNECPEFPTVNNDPGQFMVVVRPAMWFPVWDRAHSLFRSVKSDLEAKGYQVTSTPSSPCDPDRPKVPPVQ